jgi:hypothetical protein
MSWAHLPNQLNTRSMNFRTLKDSWGSPGSPQALHDLVPSSSVGNEWRFNFGNADDKYESHLGGLSWICGPSDYFLFYRTQIWLLASWLDPLGLTVESKRRKSKLLMKNFISSFFVTSPEGTCFQVLIKWLYSKNYTNYTFPFEVVEDQ